MVEVSIKYKFEYLYYSNHFSNLNNLSDKRFDIVLKPEAYGSKFF